MALAVWVALAIIAALVTYLLAKDAWQEWKALKRVWKERGK